MIGNDWDNILESIEKSEGFKRFMSKVKEEYKNYTCYPEYKNIFNALKTTSYKDTKVVILGQDPYHGEGEAHGLSFSVQKGIKLPQVYKIYLKNYMMTWVLRIRLVET